MNKGVAISGALTETPDAVAFSAHVPNPPLLAPFIKPNFRYIYQRWHSQCTVILGNSAPAMHKTISKQSSKPPSQKACKPSPSQSTCPVTPTPICIPKKSVSLSLSFLRHNANIGKIAAGATIASHLPMHQDFLVEAVRLRKKYSGQIKILIGFEGEWIRPSYSILINELASHPDVDYFIGSVHHVHSIPIDYDAAFYNAAREAAGGTDEKLFEDYFNSQFEMLKALKPRVVGHFDLIRLKSDEPDRDLRKWKGVWESIVRNLGVVVEQGGMLELNTSALRKGLEEPYPRREICEEFLRMGGKLTLSDDSHGVAQVGTNFGRAVEFLEGMKVGEIWTMERSEDGSLVTVSVTVENIKKSLK